MDGYYGLEAASLTVPLPVTLLQQNCAFLPQVLTAAGTKGDTESQHSPAEVNDVDVKNGDLWTYSANAMRGLDTGELKDAPVATEAGAILLQEGSRAVVFGSDPIIGFMILTGIVLAALVAWLTYHLILFAGSSSRELGEVAPGMSPETTEAVLRCLTEAETRLSCLACVATSTSPDTCG